MPPLARDQAASLLSSEMKAAANSNSGCVCCVKCVLVGDGAVGKTSLVVSYTTNGYPTEYVPTAFDNYSVVVTVDNQPVRLQLCDTAGQDDFDSLRPLCYPNTAVFLLCFSVVCPTSFQNVSQKWLPEIRRHCPEAPIVIVGTQCDLRTDVKVLIELSRYGEQPVPEAVARQTAHRVGAEAYVECSALTQKNLKEVFDTAIVAALREQNPDVVSFGRARGKKCLLGAGLKPVLTSQNQRLYDEDLDGRPRKKTGWKKLCCFA
ncbi:cell division control protein 42 homolog [Ornithodoros turicata]|uniref:Putative ras-related small gtpase rho type n=1 Tax=Ornithodoros turicata TaxID=34597 RepID=A0A2R5L566_9ACAR